MSKCILETRGEMFVKNDWFGKKCYGVIRKDAPFGVPVMKEWVLENQKNIVNLKVVDGELIPVEYKLLYWQKDLMLCAYNQAKRFYKKLIKLGFKLEADVEFGVGYQINIDGIMPYENPFDIKRVINEVSFILMSKSTEDIYSYKEAYTLKTKANILNGEDFFNMVWSKKYSKCSPWLFEELAKRVDIFEFLSDIDGYELDLESKMM